ncbi:MAG: DUF3300 domain-containing protein [Syntrophobacteraceae bacterium]
MNTRLYFLRVLVGFLVLLMAAPPWTLAQGTFRQEELDQMLAPIALYPDSLLGQILVAATYPDQVTEADRWVRQNNTLQGVELNAALDSADWDLSVKALVPFPQVLAMMSDKMEWTQRMGDAFMTQQSDVMETIQSLRHKAHAQGNLKSTDQLRIAVRGQSIEILPANPRVIYVPTYNPTVIYGSWWHPAYPPYAYNPYYPQYAYDPYYTGHGFVTAGLFGFATGIAVGSIWNSGWGRWDWGGRNVNVNINRTININRDDIGRSDIRTSNWQQVNRQRRALRSERQAVGQARTQRAAERSALRTRTEARSEAANKRIQQRQNKAQANRQVQQRQNKAQADRQVQQRQNKAQADRRIQQRQNKAQADRKIQQRQRTQTQTDRRVQQRQNKAQMRSAQPSGKANAQVRRAQSQGKANAQMRRAQPSGKDQGASLNRGGGNARAAAGGGHAKHD